MERIPSLNDLHTSKEPVVNKVFKTLGRIGRVMFRIIVVLACISIIKLTGGYDFPGWSMVTIGILIGLTEN